MSGTYYAGDVGVAITLGPMATGSVDGTTIDSARIMAVSPGGGAAIELDVSITAQSTTSVTLTHVTTGSMARAGDWLLRAYYYDGASLVLSSRETTLTVTTRRVAPPT